MKIYAIIGTNTETIDQTSNPVCPPDHIEMTEARPTPEHIAQAGGTWTVPVPTPEQIQAQLMAAVERHLIKVANTRNYDSPDSSVKYINSSVNPVWAAEGQALVDWSARVWMECHLLLDKVTVGEMEIPTAEELIDMLPQMEWPS